MVMPPVTEGTAEKLLLKATLYFPTAVSVTEETPALETVVKVVPLK